MRLNTFLFLLIVSNIFVSFNSLKAINDPENSSVTLQQFCVKLEKSLQEVEKSVVFTKVEEKKQSKQLIKLYGDELKKIIKQQSPILLSKEINIKAMQQLDMHLERKENLRKLGIVSSWLISFGTLYFNYKLLSKISFLWWTAPVIGGNRYICTAIRTVIALAVAGTVKGVTSFIARKAFSKYKLEKFSPQVIRITKSNIHNMYKSFLKTSDYTPDHIEKV